MTDNDLVAIDLTDLCCRVIRDPNEIETLTTVVRLFSHWGIV